MRYVSYVRVSTDRQGLSGLGLDAQRKIVCDYVKTHGGEIIQEFVEVESGKRSDRPQLALAIAHAKRNKATLLVAKADRLARNARFLLTVVEASSVVFCDLPAASGAVGKFMLTQMASVAELEAGLISERTKAALAQAKARGVVLGGYRSGTGHAMASAKMSANTNAWRLSIQPVIMALKLKGLSLHAIATEMNNQGIEARRGGSWDAKQISRIVNSH